LPRDRPGALQSHAAFSVRRVAETAGLPVRESADV
jgi:hypothetical protein